MDIKHLRYHRQGCFPEPWTGGAVEVGLRHASRSFPEATASEHLCIQQLDQHLRKGTELVPRPVFDQGRTLGMRGRLSPLGQYVATMVASGTMWG